MRGLKIIIGSLALALAFPGLAAAQEGIATGAVIGAITGGLVGGPIGAVIGGVAGAALGDADAVTSQSEPLYQVSMIETHPQGEGPAAPGWRTPASPAKGSPQRDLVLVVQNPATAPV